MKTKTLGVVGGIAPESTIEYYRLLVAGYRERTGDGSYPSILINSIDLQKMMAFVGAGELSGLVEYLSDALMRLVRAGADVALVASNTPHIVFEDLRKRSPIPMLSIVEAACAAAETLGLTRLGLLGTRFTMQGRFYPEVFSRRGIALVVPSPEEQDYVHDRYMGELVRAVFRPETRERILAIVDRLAKHEGIQGVILGGTELPFLFREGPDLGIPFLDTTRIHAARAIELLTAG